MLTKQPYRFSLFLLFLALLGSGILLLSRGSVTVEEVAGPQEGPGPADSSISDNLSDEAPFLGFIRHMDQELEESGTVGAAYTIVQGGKIVYTGTYGERKLGSHEAVDEHTLFRLASVSKGFTGILACMLDQEGILSLDDKVKDLYPGFRLKDPVNTEEMTVRNLLSHTSGLVPFAFDNLVEAGVELNTIIGRLDEVDISAPPGQLYGYQNVVFSMFDPITRRATGIPYQLLLSEKIFRPLGMSDASAGPVDHKVFPNMAYPHIRTRNGYVPLNMHDGFYNVLPAAGINASISDMGQWLLALLGYRSDVVADTLLKTIARPVIYTPLKYRYTRYWKPFRERYYSLGWRIYRYQGREIIYHGGYIQGYRAEIGFCPEEDIGFVFLENSPNGLASSCVPAFFNSIFDPS